MNKDRILEQKLKDHFKKFKQAIVLVGPRQAGKTTLLKKIFPDALYLLVDNELIREKLETYNIQTYQTIINHSKQIIIDELHLLSNPGRAVKIIYDQIENIQIIVTGSSALHIKNNSSESMAGRKIEYDLFPLTFGEYLFQQEIIKDLVAPIINGIEKKQVVTEKLYPQTELLQDVLSFGQYPDTLNLPDKKKYLIELADSAIFKDIISLNLIENRAKAKNLLKLLAYQIGNLINYQELSNKLSLDRRTIERYIEIFEQSFILYRIYPFSKNPREEIGKAPKIYFWDLGLRNALINNFDLIDNRNDAGAMFENFIINEVKKEISYLDLDYNVNYWRHRAGGEVDLVLSNNNSLVGCEIKLKSGSISKGFTNRYPEAKTHVINAENFF